MSYRSLFNRRQAEATYLPRSWYIQDAEMLQWVRSITIKVDEALNKEGVRGLIRRKNAEIIGGLPRFDYTIIIAEGMGIEWERFIVIKELMHCYFGPTPDNEQYLTDNPIVLETHARQIFGDSALVPGSPHVKAERMAIWMALGVLSTENDRQAFIRDLAAQTTTTQQIASTLKIPVRQAAHLTSPQYDDELAAILK